MANGRIELVPDCRPALGCRLPSFSVCNQRNYSHTMISLTAMIQQLMAWRDVKKVALAKYKSEEGLEAEFEKRKLLVYFPFPPAQHNSGCPAVCSHTRAQPPSDPSCLT